MGTLVQKPAIMIVNAPTLFVLPSLNNFYAINLKKENQRYYKFIR